MTPLQWHDSPEKAIREPAKRPQGNPWMIIAILLIAGIAGFLLASHVTSSGQSAMRLQAPTRAPTDITDNRIVEITVDNWKFTPGTIRATRGEGLTIRLTGVNGVHGFAVRELGINEQILPGKTVSVILPTDTAGIFPFFCSIACGPGHADMEGTIIIE